MLWKMSLRKRILIAAGAIAVIHFLFWFTPRWWVTRPRFYEDAWRAAVSILEEEVGAKAVEAGIFRIPRAKVSVPYEGECAITRSWCPEAFLSVGVRDCWFILRLMRRRDTDGVLRPEEPVRVRRLSRDEARRLWATVKYAMLAEGDIDEATVVPYGNVTAEVDVADRTWGRGRAPLATEEKHVVYITSAGEFLRHNCLAWLFARWSAGGTLDLSTDREDVARATEALLRSSLPPVSKWDELRINNLTLYYAAAAGRSGIGLLEEIDALRQASGDYWLWRMKPVRRLLGLQRRRRGTYQYYGGLEGAIWALRELEGKDREAAIETAAGAAFSHERLRIRERARDYLARNAPERLRTLIAENIPRLTQTERSDLLGPCIRWFGDDPAVAGLARDVAEVATSPAAGRRALLYLAANHRDGDAFDKLVEMSTDSDIWGALSILRHLMHAYRRDNSIGDVPGLLRKRLVEFAALQREARDEYNRTEPIADLSILSIIGQAGGEESLAVLKEALEGQLANVEPSTAVWPIARYWPAEVAGPVLAGFLESRPMRDWGDTEREALEALRRLRYLPALPVLERFFSTELPGANPTTARRATVPLPERTEDPLEVLRLTILGLRIRSAADPIASFRAVDERDRPAVAGALVRVLAERHEDSALKEMLADPRHESERSRIYEALVLRGREER